MDRSYFNALVKNCLNHLVFTYANASNHEQLKVAAKSVIKKRYQSDSPCHSLSIGAQIRLLIMVERLEQIIRMRVDPRKLFLVFSSN